MSDIYALGIIVIKLLIGPANIDFDHVRRTELNLLIDLMEFCKILPFRAINAKKINKNIQ